MGGYMGNTEDDEFTMTTLSDEEKDGNISDYETGDSPKGMSIGVMSSKAAAETWHKASPKRKEYEKQRQHFRIANSLSNIAEDAPHSPEAESPITISSPSPSSLATPQVSGLSKQLIDSTVPDEPNMTSPLSLSPTSPIRITLMESSNNLMPSNTKPSSPPNNNVLTPRAPSIGSHKRHISFELLNEIKSKKITLSERFKSNKVSASGSAILASSPQVDEVEIIGIRSYTAAQIWKKSTVIGRNNIAKYTELYPHLMQQFQKWTGITKRCPSRSQLRGYFIKYSPSTNHKANIELLMHSNQFEPFYDWFKAMSNIIKDFRYLYDSDDDILNALFCTGKQAKQKLMECEVGTFLIRIGSKPNKLYISCKLKQGDVQHFKFLRIEDEIYQHGRTQNPIFKWIRSTQHFVKLYSAESKVITVAKSQYF